MKRTALVICPGRGTYNKEELGYLGYYHTSQAAFIDELDAYRRDQGQTPVSELDGRKKYSLAVHGRGDNASPLIYACSYADFLSIDRQHFDIVAITGNSMGWYIALACGAALTPEGGMQVINTMGTLMHEALIGGQIVYPLVDEDWRPVPGRREQLLRLIADINSREACELSVSIELGGRLVFGGNEAALEVLQGQLEPLGRFPMRLYNHAAFHTPLQQPVAERAQTVLPGSLFQAPQIPLIDGRGHIWTPWSSDPAQLWRYTFDHQICQAYDFTSAVQVAVKEYAPECIIVTGPGNSLGGAIAQSLIGIGWQGLADKQEFSRRQKDSPYLLSMGLAEQRASVSRGQAPGCD